MRLAPPRRVGLLLSLTAALATAYIGSAAHAQTTPKASHGKPEPAMSSYERAVNPAKAAQGVGEGSDPLEPLNRKIFAFNQVLDRVLIRPLAVFWHHAAPKPVRLGINNFLSNLGEPVVIINDVLQGRPVTAVHTVGRFAVNTTFGLLGTIDVATYGDLPHHDNGFGLTLGRWGVKSGPYIYLPILGPSTVRDGIGEGVDALANPLTYSRNTGSGGLITGLGIAGGLDARADADSDLRSLQALSTDQYAALRSFYLQNRQAQITGGKIDLNALPDFDDPEAGKTATTQPAATALTPQDDAAAPPRQRPRRSPPQTRRPLPKPLKACKRAAETAPGACAGRG